MRRHALSTAPSDHFRRKLLLETAGECIGQALAPRGRGWLKRVYHGALMLQTGGRGMACRLPGGEQVRVLPECRNLSWNPSEYGAFREAVRPGAVALDVGANAGAYALLLGLWVGPSGRVFAFEPEPSVHRALERHVRLNSLDGIVQLVPAAVSDREGTAELDVSGALGESRLSVQGRHGAVVPVPTVTIDAFCARHGIRPDFIKVDIEGWELAALRGARDTIASRGAALALFVELHPSIWPELGLTRDDFLGELEMQRLLMHPLIPGSDPWAVEGVSVRLVPR